ncbi:fimbrial biogenesis outer membrane usher protein, partial [Klebsiella pneumoniae]|nr:fimbrial biogenesis outer membrane usher protein [Klebsiella pneumoniae]MCB3555491.1 fimbrial biogenesis outer membrane usher protein [Klebsiella pneumoniae]HBT1521753.1 fimbrial biogenesis outer membrane usher protein [Klebsiella pneumoniae]
QTGYVGGGQGNSSASGNASLNYRGGYGNANVGYSQNRDGSQLYYGMSGGILAHADGITLSQPLNSTSVLVKVPGAGDVRVENQTGVTTDWRGYAVIPYATEYRENRIALNTNTLEDNVELDESVVRVVPTHGAIVRADFKVNIGLKILMTLTRNGKPVPFGAVVSTEGSKGGSIVADNGQVYLSGMPQAGKLQVKWGDSADSRCVASYSLHEESLKQALVNLAAECR